MWIKIQRSETCRFVLRRHGVEALGALDDGTGHVALALEGLDVGHRPRRIEFVEVGVSIGVRRDRRRLPVAGEDAREPTPLDERHVPHDAEQAERGGRHVPAHQRVTVELLAFPQQRGALVLEPRRQHRPLIARQGGSGRVTGGSTGPP